jgi:dTDP-4-amino-4,6-dideoxygalactose transaminase
MGDLHAAIAAAQLDRLADLLARRRAIAARYDEAFAEIGLTRPAPPPEIRPVAWRYLLRVDDAGALIDRLTRRGIQARRPVYIPLHRLTTEAGQFPVADDAQRRLVSLPLHPELTPAEIDRVIDEVRRCLL